MKITAIKTHKITVEDTNVFAVLDRYLSKPKEGTIVVVTSKIVAICEGRVANPQRYSKEALIIKEAEYYLPRSSSKYNFLLTIKNNLLIPSAGVDESNGNGLFILWPSDPQKSANEIRAHLAKKFRIKKLGVIITDSKTSPLRWGVTGTALAHSGFFALNNYIGKPDLFGRKLKVTRVNVADALAAAAVVVMGEGREQTPIAIIEEVPFVKFQQRNPSRLELEALHINIEDDLYAPLLTSVKWERRKGKP